MKYDIPILGPEHAEFCKREAERRYEGKLIKRGGMLTVQDAQGFCHLDAVLRALTNWERRR